MRGPSFWARLIGRKPDAPADGRALLTAVVTARLNVRSIPEDRSFYYGDPLDAVLAERSLGEVTDGGTMFDTGTGRIEYTDLEIGLQDASAETLAVITDTLESLGAPVGSYLDVHAERRKIHFGRYEGLALAVARAAFRDPDDPAGEVNALLTALEAGLGDAGAFRGYWEGEDDCELYFYGPAYEPMRAKIAAMAAAHPELTHCRVSQIA